jgi:hypothetical protein
MVIRVRTESASSDSEQFVTHHLLEARPQAEVEKSVEANGMRQTGSGANSGDSR